MARTPILTSNWIGWVEGGYRRIRVRGRVVMEHRYVWEQAYGPIPEKHVIHHRNGDKLDNRLENLEAMPIGAHLRRHKAGKPIHPNTEAAKVKALAGRPLSVAHKATISAAVKANHHKPEYTPALRAKMSASAKARCAKYGTGHLSKAGIVSAQRRRERANG